MTGWLLALVLLAAPPQDASPRAGDRPEVGTIRGHVTRDDGRPLARARVRLIPTGARRGQGLAGQTELDGTFELADIPVGQYRVAAAKEGFLGAEYGQPAPLRRGDRLDVRAGVTLTKIDMRLSRPGVIEGHVVDENGDPVDRVSVRVLEVRFEKGRRTLVDARDARPQLTNDQGRYRVYGLAPGEYFVSATVGQIATTDLPGYAPTYFPGTAAVREAAPVSLALAEQRRGVDFALAPVRTARIAGTVIDSQGRPAGGSLTLTPTARSGAVGASVGARIEGSTGRFEFTNVAPGEYVIQSYRGRQNAAVDGEFAAEILTVSGVDLTGLVIRTSAGSGLSGRIVFEGPSPPRANGIEIAAVPIDLDLSPRAGGGATRLLVDGDWSFRAGGLNGIRLLRATRLPREWALKGIYVEGVEITDTALAFGTDRDAIANVEIVLTPAVTEIAGTVVDARGRLLDEYAVIVYAVDSQLWSRESRFVRLARPDEKGVFSVRGLPPGSYNVSVLEDVRGDEWQDPQRLEALSSRASRLTLAVGEQRRVTERLR